MSEYKKLKEDKKKKPKQNNKHLVCSGLYSSSPLFLSLTPVKLPFN